MCTSRDGPADDATVHRLSSQHQDGRYRFTAADLAHRAEQAGFAPKGDIVWSQAGARLRPYGYPKAYVPNIVHQHIVVLRAE